MRRPIRKYREISLYSADITGDILARRIFMKYTKYFLYFKRKNKPKRLLRAKVRKASKFKSSKSYYAYFKMQKQKLRHYYGHIPNTYVKKLVSRIRKKKTHNKDAAKKCLQYLESRMDVTVRRLHFARTIQKSRNLISNGVILLNKKLQKEITTRLKFFQILNIKQHAFRLVKKNIFFSRIINAIHLMYPKYFEVNFKILHALFLGLKKLRDVFFPFKRRISKKRMKKIFSFKRRQRLQKKLNANLVGKRKRFKYKRRTSFYKKKFRSPATALYFYVNRC